MVNLIAKKLNDGGENELVVKNFEQIIKLLTLECRFINLKMAFDVNRMLQKKNSN